ncbi:MAG: L,D-transpeptidase/peptidoglycan binding protein [Lachnospiraceae bacterium]|nr:L,D-transpeptidase/peptidoglycan binding protein [Lachnospiraceae bacterium]
MARSKSGELHIGLWFIGAFLVLGTMVYLGVALMLYNTFLPGTWINNVYCTGLTVQEADGLLRGGTMHPAMKVVRGDAEYSIDFPAGSYSCDFTGCLQEYLREANCMHWPMAMIAGETRVTITPEFVMSDDHLIEQWENLPFVKADRDIDRTLRLDYSRKEGYTLYNGLVSRLKEEQARADFLTAAHDGTVLFTVDEGYYENVSLSEADEACTRLYEKIEAFQSCDLVFDMGKEQIAMEPGIMAGFLLKENGFPYEDEFGNLAIDYDAADAYVTELLDQYTTYGKPREFFTSLGDVVTVKGGTYGTSFDTGAELEFFRGALTDPQYFDGEATAHIPKYKKEPYVRGLDDLGDTYIEVDMTNQKAYAYVKGELLLESDVVTGNRGCTPEGTDFIYFKQKNRTLIGPDYRTFVYYWMAVNEHIGLHDATWRSKFGGNIYMGNGSHGCINMPKKVAATLYETYEVGTPVILYYRK